MSYLDMEYRKAKTAPKISLPAGELLEKKISEIIEKISSIVGSTLGPNGQTILIERPDPGLPPYQTKDGVTVIRTMAEHDEVKQVILETVRDAAIKTVENAGDGPQPLWSKILTPTGFVSMNDVKIGMKICGTKNTIQTITGIFPKGEKEIVKVTFSDGRIVECCEDHLWTVTTSYGVEKTLTTKEIMNSFVSEYADYNKYNYYVNKPEVFTSNEKTPLDAYLLGVLLGDGCLRDSGSIELSLGKKKEHILNKLILPKGIIFNSSFIENKNSFRVKITGKTKDGKSIRDILEEIGLKNTNSNTKFIPNEYLFSSKYNREKLLQGLIDTDGYVNNRGRFEFSSVSVDLANDVANLARSLGKAVYTTVHLRNENDGSFSDKAIHKVYELKGFKYGDQITNVEKTGKRTLMQCIKVSNQDHLYITDGFISTHNTTTATILAGAILKKLKSFLKKNPRVSRQFAAREIAKYLNEKMLPYIEESALKINHENSKSLLSKVARISTNGDVDLSNIILEAFDMIGDNGHITMTEESGVPGFELQKTEGFPFEKGYEQSLAIFSNEFINDTSGNKIVLENPHYVLIDGKVLELNPIVPLLNMIEQEVQKGMMSPNVVILAHQFSKEVVAKLAQWWKVDGGIKILPCLTPADMLPNSQYDFLKDISAFTGGKIFNSLNYPVHNGSIQDLGKPSVSFESQRYRSIVHGSGNEETVLKRVQQLLAQSKQPNTTKLAYSILEERAGRLSGGIAKLVIRGVSDASNREIKDRAEDAICAIRGAIKHGVLPGGCRILLDLSLDAESSDSLLIKEVLSPALREPLLRLLLNCGLSVSEIGEITSTLISDKNKVYDAAAHVFGNPLEVGLLDSAPAVREAVRSAIEIATAMSTLGGVIVFARDNMLEASESASFHSKMRELSETDSSEESE